MSLCALSERVQGLASAAYMAILTVTACFLTFPFVKTPADLLLAGRGLEGTWSIGWGEWFDPTRSIDQGSSRIPGNSDCVGI